jgi:hypothetical protein
MYVIVAHSLLLFLLLFLFLLLLLLLLFAAHLFTSAMAQWTSFRHTSQIFTRSTSFFRQYT